MYAFEIVAARSFDSFRSLRTTGGWKRVCVILSGGRKAGAEGSVLVGFHSHLDGVGLSSVAAAAAVGAGDVHVGEELHVQRYLPGAVTGRAAQGPGVVRERPGLQPLLLGLG